MENQESALPPTTENSQPQEQPVQDWRAGLSHEIATDGSIASFKSVEDLAKSYIHARKAISSSIRIPGEDAGDEQRKEFFDKVSKVPGIMKAPNFDDPNDINDILSRMGRPDSPSKYNVNIPEDVEVDAMRLNSFLESAHKLGLPNKQASQLVDFELQNLKAQQDISVKKAEEARDTLKQMWGTDYNNRIAGANLALQTLADKFPEQVNELTNSPAIAKPALLNMLSEFAKTIVEDRSVLGSSSRVSYGMSADEARAIASEMLGNRNHPLKKSRHPEHKAAVDKLTNL